jgi:uncharacterized membrane protein
MKKIIQITLVILIAFITGCYYDSEERLYPSIYNPCDDAIPTFSKTVTTILQPCMACHSNSSASGSGGGIKLENYADIQSNGRMMGAVNHTSGYSAMPKGGGKLTDCEINQLQKWIDNGMPNN